MYLIISVVELVVSRREYRVRCVHVGHDVVTHCFILATRPRGYDTYTRRTASIDFFPITLFRSRRRCHHPLSHGESVERFHDAVSRTRRVHVRSAVRTGSPQMCPCIIHRYLCITVFSVCVLRAARNDGGISKTVPRTVR